MSVLQRKTFTNKSKVMCVVLLFYSTIQIVSSLLSGIPLTVGVASAEGNYLPLGIVLLATVIAVFGACYAVFSGGVSAAISDFVRYYQHGQEPVSTAKDSDPE